MKIFDFLFKAQETAIKQTEISAKKTKSKQGKLAVEIIKRFYADYPEKPYISPNREENWIEKAEMFPKQSIIPKSIMTRFSDGLLPGHVYMLYWLKKYKDKRVPVYFEYKYGVDFEKERLFLIEKGYLNTDYKPTEKGEKAIEEHHKVIVEHNQPKAPLANEIENKKTITHQNDDDYEAWLDFLDKGGTSKEWKKRK